MECHEVVKSIGWLGETWGFWLQTGAFLLSAFAGVFIIYHNGKLAKIRALIDLIIHQKSDKELLVLICGYDEDGGLYIRSSRLTCAEAFFLANKAALWAQNGGVE